MAYTGYAQMRVQACRRRVQGGLFHWVLLVNIIISLC
jgi:hypothetical protein